MDIMLNNFNIISAYTKSIMLGGFHEKLIPYFIPF